MLLSISVIFHFLENATEVVVVGGADRSHSIPACLAKTGGDSKARLDSYNSGTADKR